MLIRFSTSLTGNSQGQLGLKDLRNRKSPVKLILPSKVVSIACSAYASFALTRQGDFYFWGVLARRYLDEDYVYDKVISFACGFEHALILFANGKLYSWGANGLGQLGLGDFSNRVNPTLIDFDFGSPISTLACGSNHSLVFTSNGKIFVWGETAHATIVLYPTLLKCKFTPKVYLVGQLFPQTHSF